MQSGVCGLHSPDVWQVLPISSPSKWNPVSQVKETVVFTRYLPLYSPLVSPVVFIWPFVGDGSAHVATKCLDTYNKSNIDVAY